MKITHIERIVLAVTLVAIAGAVTMAQAPRARVTDRGYDFQVTAQQQWIPTGILVRQGQMLRVEATGEIALNQARSVRARSGGALNQLDRAARMPSVPLGALLGQITAGGRAGAPFVIGDRASVTMPGDGELFLGINDSNFGDNSGAFAVWIDAPAEAGGRGRANANASQGYDFQITGQQQWLPTGIIVRQGEVLQLESTGEVTLNRSGTLRMQPRGATNNQLDRAARLPSAPIGSLIGRIGPASQRTSRPFPIGDLTSVTMPGDGELFLGVNDSSFADNGGAFDVWINAPEQGRRFGRGRGRGANTGNNNASNTPGRDVQVPARDQWTPTGVTVRQGDVVRFRATGEVSLNQDRSLRARSNGAGDNQIARDATLPNVPVGTLLGRIGPVTTGFGQRNRAFVIGAQIDASMPADGELFLGVNDGHFDDNSGAFTVRIEAP
jgi:hypothetical protein